ncbi:MAG: hypothetical protein ACJAZS_000344 [Alteromonas naphthalenivorans]|jgi:hypothetical protein
MKKLFSFLFISIFALTIQANDTFSRFTEREQQLYEQMKKSAKIIKALNKTNPTRAFETQKKILNQWHAVINSEMISCESVQYIEAMFWKEALKKTWAQPHTYSHVLQTYLINNIIPYIRNTWISAFAGYQTTKFFLQQLVPDTETISEEIKCFGKREGLRQLIDPYALITIDKLSYKNLPDFNNISFFNVMWKTVEENQLVTIASVVVSLIYIGGQAYWQVHEDLPLSEFKTEKEVEEFIISSQIAD